MAYHLLTGATGLLGNYLLRDLSLAGHQLAVVVRSSRTESARQRIESAQAGWERSLGRALPRPVVLEGDICQPNMGFDSVALDWIARNCDSIIHNAASLSFEPIEKTGEPHRSNVEGTRNVLETARRTNIRRFHHVSTAYVCGLRTGRVFEDELDVGQPLGNVYEESKIAAEKLVKAADHLDRPTVYRPSIIIGDSLTGYTTTYHGFYTPIKIVKALADRMDFNIDLDGTPLVAALNMNGTEHKNLVPVDLVSSVIANLIGRPDQHGRTYHVTSPNPTTIAVMCDVMVAALAEYARTDARGKAFLPPMDELQRLFTEQMETYRSYWRDDPEFDCSHTREAVPHLPCPSVDRELLLQTARYAFSSNFGWPVPQPVKARFDVLTHLSNLIPVHLENGHDPRTFRLIGFQVNGPGGGQWTLAVEGGRPVSAEFGLSTDRHALIYLNSTTYERMVRGELSVDQARDRGQVVIEADDVPRTDVLGVLGRLAGSAA